MNAEIVFILRIFLAVILYGFIILVMVTIWRSLKSEIDKQAVKAVPRLTLRILDNENNIEKTFEQTSVTLGRDPTADLQINDSTISGKHAQFFFRQNQWWIQDLDSTNGSYLNQIQIEESMAVTDGDALRCGRVNVQITIEPLTPHQRQ